MTIYRWALIDRKGKTRMTCEAADDEAAVLEFLKRRDGLGIPRFWQVVTRGPVKAKAKPKPIEPAPNSPTPEEMLAEAIQQSMDRAAKLQKALNYPGATWDQLIETAEKFKAVIEMNEAERETIIAQKDALIETLRHEIQSNTASKLDKIKAALMGYDAAKLGGDAYSAIERFT